MKDLHEDNMFGSIRERLGRYEEAPSDELWGKIAAAPKKRRAAAWLYSGIGAVGVVALFLVMTHDETPIGTVVDEKITSKKEAAQQQQQQQQSLEQRDQTEEQQTAIYQKAVAIKESKAIEQQSISSNHNDYTEPTVIANRESQIPLKQDSSSRETKEEKKDGKKEVKPPYKKPKSRFQLYFSLSPSLSFQKIIPSDNDQIIVSGLANRSPFSMKRFGFGIDVGTQYDFNRFVGFYGGLSFYRQQQQITYNYYEKDAEVTREGDSWVFIIDRPMHSKSFDYTMTNVGAQGGVMITLKGDKLKNKLGAGLNYSQNLNSSASYLAYQVFYRNEIRINDRFSWYVQPTFTYSFITKEKLNEPFTLKPYRAGITGGVLYRFK